MKSKTNSMAETRQFYNKIGRMLDAIAVDCINLPDETIVKIHNTINDEQDGYDFDFIGAVNSYRCLLANYKGD